MAIPSLSGGSVVIPFAIIHSLQGPETSFTGSRRTCTARRSRTYVVEGGGGGGGGGEGDKGM